MNNKENPNPNPNATTTPSHPVAAMFGRFAGAGAVIVLGVVLMVVGLGLGVSIVALPLGIPLGLCGLLALLWGISTLFLRDKSPAAPTATTPGADSGQGPRPLHR